MAAILSAPTCANLCANLDRHIPLSYPTGNRMVWELKADLQDANPKRPSSDELDREFHRICLQSGCMPVASLREVFRFEGFL